MPRLRKAIENLKQGNTVLLLDDATELTTAYLVADAASITAKTISFMVNTGGGVICIALPNERIKELGLPAMASLRNSSSPDMTISVEARHGVTTGISAADRAQTLQVIATTKSPKTDLVMPGHIFPLKAKKGGVLVRSAPSEAAVDLLNAAGLTPAAAIMQCLNQEGELLSKDEIEELISTNNLCHISISDIVQERLASRSVVERIAEATLPTKLGGELKAICFRSENDNAEHLALIKGDLKKDTAVPVLVRVQAENRIGDLLNTSTLSNRRNIDGALGALKNSASGVFVYVRHPRKGVISEQVAALNAKPSSSKPKSSHQIRQYGIGAQILRELGIKKIRLLSNATQAVSGIDAFGLEITEQTKFKLPK